MIFLNISQSSQCIYYFQWMKNSAHLNKKLIAYHLGTTTSGTLLTWCYWNSTFRRGSLCSHPNTFPAICIFEKYVNSCTECTELSNVEYGILDIRFHILSMIFSVILLFLPSYCDCWSTRHNTMPSSLDDYYFPACCPGLVDLDMVCSFYP